MSRDTKLQKNITHSPMWARRLNDAEREIGEEMLRLLEWRIRASALKSNFRTSDRVDGLQFCGPEYRLDKETLDCNTLSKIEAALGANGFHIMEDVLLRDVPIGAACEAHEPISNSNPKYPFIRFRGCIHTIEIELGWGAQLGSLAA